MAGDEREKNRIASANVLDPAPIGVLRPGDDFAACSRPAQDSRAVVRADYDFILIIGDLDRRLVLE
jgi:hypothetical protein